MRRWRCGSCAIPPRLMTAAPSFPMTLMIRSLSTPYPPPLPSPPDCDSWHGIARLIARLWRFSPWALVHLAGHCARWGSLLSIRTGSHSPPASWHCGARTRANGTCHMPPTRNRTYAHHEWTQRRRQDTWTSSSFPPSPRRPYRRRPVTGPSRPASLPQVSLK